MNTIAHDTKSASIFIDREKLEQRWTCSGENNKERLATSGPEPQTSITECAPLAVQMTFGFMNDLPSGSPKASDYALESRTRLQNWPQCLCHPDHEHSDCADSLM